MLALKEPVLLGFTPRGDSFSLSLAFLLKRGLWRFTVRSRLAYHDTRDRQEKSFLQEAYACSCIFNFASVQVH